VYAILTNIAIGKGLITGTHIPYIKKTCRLYYFWGL